VRFLLIRPTVVTLLVKSPFYVQQMFAGCLRSCGEELLQKVTARPSVIAIQYSNVSSLLDL